MTEVSRRQFFRLAGAASLATAIPIPVQEVLTFGPFNASPPGEWVLCRFGIASRVGDYFEFNSVEFLGKIGEL